MSYAEWCTECVRGRGRDAAHPRKKTASEGPPLVQLDYTFLRTGAPEDKLATLLVAVHPGDPVARKPTYGLARVVQAKGRGDARALGALHAWFEEAALTGAMRLRTDSEPSIKAIAQAAALRRAPAETHLETTLVGSSDSLGACERFAQTVAGLARTWLAVERDLGITVLAVSPIFGWLVRHVVFLYNMFQPHGALGETAYGQLQGRPYRSPMLPFGTPVLLRRPGVLEQGKLEERWIDGLWLGRRHDSDEHVVATKEGIIAGRTVKRLDRDQLNVVNLYRQIQWAAPELAPSIAGPEGAGATAVASKPALGGACHAKGRRAPRVPCDCGSHGGLRGLWARCDGQAAYDAVQGSSPSLVGDP